MKKNKNFVKDVVIESKNYDLIDGRNAYHSDIKRLTMGKPTRKENEGMEIAIQVWKENEDGSEEIDIELPIHQIMDLMIFVSRGLLHFKDAYRLPLLYDPENPVIERVGVQGGVMPVSVCSENPDIKKDIKEFSQAISNLGELTGERMRTLYRIIEEME